MITNLSVEETSTGQLDSAYIPALKVSVTFTSKYERVKRTILIPASTTEAEFAEVLVDWGKDIHNSLDNNDNNYSRDL